MVSMFTIVYTQSLGVPDSLSKYIETDLWRMSRLVLLNAFAREVPKSYFSFLSGPIRRNLFIIHEDVQVLKEQTKKAI